MSTQTKATTQSHSHKLGWFLCWAVVFADIGTSLYYVPGILYGEVGALAGLFVILSSIVFVLLVIKYIDITARYPEGGGVVTVATNAFGPWFGVLGGMFITVDYFLTASISSVSGFAYLNSVVDLGGMIVLFAILGVLALGILNIIGISESAKVTAVVAIGAFIIDIILVSLVATQVGSEGWKAVFSNIEDGLTNLNSPVALLTGFAGSFLAFSGLESISQLSPAMQTPRRKVATIAMGFVVVAIMFTSPFLTLFSTNLITAKVPNSDETILESVSNVEHREEELIKVNKELEAGDVRAEKKAELETEKVKLEKEVKEGKEYSERFMSELGAQYGGSALKIAVVATASVLLIFAANTAIIGAYHVFIALSRGNFLPHRLQDHNTRFDTPHWSVILATVPPILIIFATQGDVTLLGHLYAFGLLGAFGLSSIGLDVVRWKDNPKVTLGFAVGVITSVLVCIAWITNLINKPQATMFGGTISVVGMIIAFIIYKYFPHTKEVVDVKVEKTKEATKGQIFVPFYDEFDSSLFEFAAAQAKLINKSVIVMYIREFADVLQTVSESIEKDEEAAKLMAKAEKIINKAGVKVEGLYRATSDTADVINETRKKIKPVMTIITPYKHSRVLDFIEGNVVKKVLGFPNGKVLIYTK